eukprot:362778-Chlamydomonas_euryale.AAC.4
MQVPEGPGPGPLLQACRSRKDLDQVRCCRHAGLGRTICFRVGSDRPGDAAQRTHRARSHLPLLNKRFEGGRTSFKKASRPMNSAVLPS